MADKPILIGLTGLAGSGKDTLADGLVLRAGFVKLAFADALRQEVQHAFELVDGFDRAAGWALLTDRATKQQPHERLALGWCTNLEFVQAVNRAVFAGDMPLDELDVPRSPRQILQWWGTEYRRAQNEHYWVIKLLERMADLAEGGSRHLVITDCRFANEALAVRDAGGELWQVFRPGQAVLEGGHASQQSGDALRPERIVVNNGTVDALVGQGLRLLAKYHGGAVLPIEIEGVTR